MSGSEAFAIWIDVCSTGADLVDRQGGTKMDGIEECSFVSDVVGETACRVASMEKDVSTDMESSRISEVEGDVDEDVAMEESSSNIGCINAPAAFKISFLFNFF